MTTPAFDHVTRNAPARDEVRTLIDTMRTVDPHRQMRTVPEPLDEARSKTAPSFSEALDVAPAPRVLDALPPHALVVDRVEACALTLTERDTLKTAMRRAGLASFDQLG